MSGSSNGHRSWGTRRAQIVLEVLHAAGARQAVMAGQVKHTKIFGVVPDEISE